MDPIFDLFLGREAKGPKICVTESRWIWILFQLPVILEGSLSGHHEQHLAFVEHHLQSGRTEHSLASRVSGHLSGVHPDRCDRISHRERGHAKDCSS